MLQAPITTSEVTPELKGIELEIQVAGQVFQQRFEPEPNLEHRFVWDGFDAYQRRVQGSVTAHVSVSYLYDVTYVLTPRMDASFGQRGEDDSQQDGHPQGKTALHREPPRDQRPHEQQLALGEVEDVRRFEYQHQPKSGQGNGATCQQTGDGKLWNQLPVHVLGPSPL